MDEIDTTTVNWDAVPTPLHKVAKESGWGPKEITKRIMMTTLDYYTGNAVQTLDLMAADGWEKDRLPSVSTLRQLSHTKEWQTALEERGEQLAIYSHDGIAKAREVKAFLTETIRSKNIDTKTKLKAAEMLGKCYSMFTDRREVDVQGKFGLQELIREANGGNKGQEK